MRKKELLAMKPLYVTPQMKKVVKEDKEYDAGYDYIGWQGRKQHIKQIQYEHYLFFAAAVDGDILKVSVFTRKRILEGKKEPQYDIYLSKKEKKWMVYEHGEDKWRTAKVDMLDYDTGKVCALYRTKNYQSKSTRNLVNNFLETGNREVEAAILDFQSDVRKTALEKKHKNEIKEIDEVMNEVPELPKDFEAWVEKYGFIKHKYMMYQKEKGKYKYYCTHCKKWVHQEEKPEHNKKTVCKECGTELEYKSWNKQKYLEDEEAIGILQRLTDDTGYILRKFHCSLKRAREIGWEKEPKLILTENVRVKLDKYFAETDLYEYGEYKYTGVHRWCHTCRRSTWGYYTRHYGSAVMYTRNMRKELKRERFVRMDLKKVFEGDRGKRVEPVYILRVLEKYPQIEYLQKTGLYMLGKEVMKAQEESGLFDTDAVNMIGFLKIDKQRIQRLKKVNGGCRVLKALQYEVKSGEKLTEQHLYYIKTENINIEELGMYRTHMSLCKTLNFLQRQQKKEKMDFRRILGYYKDYLDMAEERGMDLTDEIVCKNNRMMEYHNIYLEEKNREKNQKRDREVNRKFGQIAKNYEKNKEHFAWENKKYAVIVPKRASDITKEGRLQHHCVGASDTYMGRMARGESYILFLRRNGNMQQPYYTLEVDYTGKIKQAYAAYDRKPDWENEIEKLLEKYTKEIQKRTRKEQKLEVAEAVKAPVMAYAG